MKRAWCGVLKSPSPQVSSHSFDSISPCCDKISFAKSLISSHLSYSGPPVRFPNDSVLEISEIWVKDHGWGSFSEILWISSKVFSRFQGPSKTTFLKETSSLVCKTKFRTKWGVVCKNWMCGSRVISDKLFRAHLP